MEVTTTQKSRSKQPAKLESNNLLFFQNSAWVSNFFFLGIREKSSSLCTEMVVMLCCLYCSGGPDLSADDSEEAEKVENINFILW